MDNRNWQNAFGTPTEVFRKQLHDTLNDLEEKEMKKRYKFTTVLLAAVIAAALIVSAGFAASRLRIFESLGFDPLEGAEEMVLTGLGSVENDLVKMTVLEAVYDGHSSIIELQITPKDPDNYALYAEYLYPRLDEYVIEESFKEVRNGSHRRHVDINGVVTEASTFEMDGKTYYADHTISKIVGRKDGRTMIEYWAAVGLLGSGTVIEREGDSLFSAYQIEEQPDGGAIVWCTSYREELYLKESVDLSVSLGLLVNGERVHLDSIPVTMVKAEDERVVDLVPVEDGKIKDFQLIDAEIRFTRIQGYLSMEYCEWVPYYKWINLYLYDEHGNEIRLAGGGGYEEEIDENCSRVFWDMEMQPLEEIPQMLYLEVRVPNGDGEEVLGRIACRVIEQN